MEPACELSAAAHTDMARYWVLMHNRRPFTQIATTITEF
jgi:hypothetical protein